MPNAGYEYLLAYNFSTDQTCPPSLRSGAGRRVVQAARSGMQNIAEGYCEESLASYIKLSGVSYGSLEELLKDYLSFARQRKIPLWGKERVLRDLGELRELWGILRKTSILPDSPEFPKLPEDPEHAVNLMITLVHQASYLTKKLMVALEEKHEKEGGFSEKLLRKRLNYRKYHGSTV